MTGPMRGRSGRGPTISRFGSISRTPTRAAWSITPIISASWSARVRTCCAPSASNKGEALEAGDGVYAVTEVTIKYRAPARLEDALLVVSKVREVRAASCLIHQSVMRGDRILAEALVTVAFLSPDGRPRRQPREWVRLFQGMEKEGVR